MLIACPGCLQWSDAVAMGGDLLQCRKCGAKLMTSKPPFEETDAKHSTTADSARRDAGANRDTRRNRGDGIPFD